MRNIASGLAVVCLALSAQGGAMAATSSDTAWGSLDEMNSSADRQIGAMALSRDGVSLGFICSEVGYWVLLAPTRSEAITFFDIPSDQARVTLRIDDHPPVHGLWKVISGRDGKGFSLTSSDANKLHEAISAGQHRLSVQVEGRAQPFSFPVARVREELGPVRAACVKGRAAGSRR